GAYDTLCFWQRNALTQTSKSPDYPAASVAECNGYCEHLYSSSGLLSAIFLSL
ncbi:hypothetical protein PO909_022106, partial [Leuciscus waleckii]